MSDSIKQPTFKKLLDWFKEVCHHFKDFFIRLWKWLWNNSLDNEKLDEQIPDEENPEEIIAEDIAVKRQKFFKQYRINNSLEWDLEDHNFTRENITELCELLKNDKDVTLLDLANIKFTAKDFTLLVDSLSQNQSLETLRLHDTNLAKANSIEIAKYLSNNETLKSLDISWNKLFADVTEKLVESLVNHPNITSLNISRNNIREKGESIRHLLENSPKLKELYCQDCVPTESSIEHILDAVGKSLTLKRFHFYRQVENAIEINPNHILNMLENNRSLYYLGIQINDQETLYAIWEKLILHPSIREVKIVGCGINNENIKILLKDLPRSNLNLIELSRVYSRAALSSEEIIYLARQLHNSPHIVCLNLGIKLEKNETNRESYQSLDNVMKNHPNLLYFNDEVIEEKHDFILRLTKKLINFNWEYIKQLTLKLLDNPELLIFEEYNNIIEYRSRVEIILKEGIIYSKKSGYKEHTKQEIEEIYYNLENNKSEYNKAPENSYDNNQLNYLDFIEYEYYMPSIRYILLHTDKIHSIREYSISGKFSLEEIEELFNTAANYVKNYWPELLKTSTCEELKSLGENAEKAKLPQEIITHIGSYLSLQEMAQKTFQNKIKAERIKDKVLKLE